MTKSERTSTGDAPFKRATPTSAPEMPMSGTEDPMSFAYRYKNATWMVYNWKVIPAGEPITLDNDLTGDDPRIKAVGWP